MLKKNWLLGLISLFIIAAVFLGPVRYTAGDARNTLLTSEAILQHGTIKLDGYCEHASLCGAESRIWLINGHRYHFLPIGNELLSLPIVGLFNAAGFSAALWKISERICRTSDLNARKGGSLN